MRKSRSVDIDSAKVMQNVLKELRIKAPSFAKELGYSTANAIYNITSGVNVISDDMIDNIVKKFPNVHYWYLKKGTLPVLIENKKLEQAQANIFDSKKANKLDYNLESFVTLKKIEGLMAEQLEVSKGILELLQTQKKADQ